MLSLSGDSSRKSQQFTLLPLLYKHFFCHMRHLLSLNWMFSFLQLVPLSLPTREAVLSNILDPERHA
jgi:hypothetical protein